MVIVALVATIFAAALLRSPVQPRWSTPTALTSSVLFSGYIFFGGVSANPFCLLYVLAAALAAWFLSDWRLVMQVGWLAGVYALALWLSHSLGEPSWPGLSDPDFGFLVAGVGALAATTLLTRMVKRRLLEGDQRLAAVVEFSGSAVNAVDGVGVINVWNPGAERLYGYAAAEAVGQPVSLIHPVPHRGTEEQLVRRVLGGEQVENYQTERMCKDGSIVTVSMSITPIWDAHQRVVGASSIARDITASLGAQDEIRHQRLHDDLTGLPNRMLFLDRVEQALARSDLPLAVLAFDLDKLKLVNDSVGHEAGDELLRLTASRVASALPPSATLAHLGGGEFVVLCERGPAWMSPSRVASRLIAAMRNPFVLNGVEKVLSASIGIALSTPDTGAAELLRDADAAMHEAGATGGGRSEVFHAQIRDRVVGRVRREAALRTALAADDQIYAHYQPLVSLRSGKIVGAEALARWQHPDWGQVSPAEFIPIAEVSGLIHQLGAQIMHRAAHECAAWQSTADFTGIAVNVSTRQLVEPHEVATLVREAIAKEGIAPGFLTLEITESVLIEELNGARSVLESLAALGVRLSLDDFGTGYSSLGYIGALPFDSVKIDRSLIGNIVASPQADALADAVIQMGHALDKEVIAEGVETLEQAIRLRHLGCDIAQGFYFSQPLAPDALTALLADQPTWLPASAKPRRSPSPRRRPAGTRPRPASKDPKSKGSRATS